MIHKPKIQVTNNQYILNNGYIMLDKLMPKIWTPKTNIRKAIIDLQNIIETLTFTIIDTKNEYIYNDAVSEFNNLIEKIK
jgi:ubiquitin-protein ligase